MTFTLDDFQHLGDKYAHWTSRTRTSLHVAVIIGRGGIILAESSNKVGSRSLGAGYSKSTIHAERAVLKTLGDMNKLRDAILVVVRVDKHGNLCCSAPCHGCRCHLEAAMKKYGLRNVYYS